MQRLLRGAVGAAEREAQAANLNQRAPLDEHELRCEARDARDDLAELRYFSRSKQARKNNETTNDGQWDRNGYDIAIYASSSHSPYFHPSRAI